MTPSAAPLQSRKASRYAVWLLWFLVLASIPFVVRFDQPAWDVGVYRHAMDSVRAGHDPYADGIAAQEAVHRRAPGVATPLGPFTYVYSPITLPAVRCFAWMPAVMAALLYGLLYVAGTAAQSRFGLSLMEEHESRVLRFLAPVAIFFPGLLGSDNVLSGNVAYVLYGAILFALGAAIRSGRWRWYYAAVLAASCFKAPLLSLVVVPALCARRQWLKAIAVGAAGGLLFAMQPLLWPELFRNYLKAVSLQFSFNRDFGFSPAGLFSGWLFDRHLPYSGGGMIFYAAYAAPLFAGLVYLSRRYLRGEFSAERWLPVMLTGVILLNPRLMEYDVAPLALPMAVLCWRLFSASYGTLATMAGAGTVFLAANLLAAPAWTAWKLTEGPLLVVLLLGGAVTLLRSAGTVAEPVGVGAVLTEA